MCLSADWTGMLILPNPFLHSFVWCVWVCTFPRPCISCLPWMSLLWLAVACELLVWSSSLALQGSPSLLLFVGLVWLLSPFLSDLAAWVLAVWPSLSWLPPSLPPWLSSGAFWSSQSCWSLPPDIWLYLQRSGCHTFGMACRGY